QAVENIAKETTVIVIAHRLSTIVNADHVYVLSEGRIVEGGTYPELIQMDGHLNRMVKLQVLEVTK
ncbi:ABC transporter ATP-binding protein, partial [Patescibacteria group bacterium]|nr:ABC transporter ATP-binding protein [Patescibacteria group bacterium]